MLYTTGLTLRDSRAGTQGRSVYDELRAAILAGQLASGTRLREGALAERYGVSRTPVREALHRLEAEGLVRVEPHRGAVVAELALDELDEVYDIRKALETLAAVRAVGRIAAEEVAEAQAILASARAALTAGDAETLVVANDEFHRVVYRASNAPRLLSTIMGLADIIRRYRHASLSAPGRAAEVVAEHTEILAAIERGDREAIEALMERHIERARSAALRMQLERARVARVQHLGQSSVQSHPGGGPRA